jgi:cyclopropane-fatty-acyl-phospholipid synthase
MLEKQIVRYLESLRTRDIPLTVSLWDGTRVSLGSEHRVQVQLKSLSAAKYLMKPSLSSLGEAFVEGLIDVDGNVSDIIAVAERLSLDSNGGTESTLGKLPSWLARHTRRSDKKAIEYHYDVSNEFYALWLDPRMVYSCAYFRAASDSLEQAQLQKLDHICTKLRLAPGERFLDIGCGWGSLVMRAAERYGVQATGITLSENQFRLANERIRAAGLQERCRVLLEDYRDHRASTPYDKIASVGMFEHVGLANLPVYFGAAARLLRERGLFLNHGITSSDTRNGRVGMGAGEFIDRYVFPNGELPHLHRAVHDMSDADFEIHDVESLRPHYARTLEHWSRNFEENLPRAVAASDERTARIWRLYLAGCAHAFEQRWVSIYQVLASRQAHGGQADLPLTREWMYRN